MRSTNLEYKALSEAAERSPGAKHTNALKHVATDMPVAPMYSHAQLDQIIAAVKVGGKGGAKSGSKGTQSPGRGRSPGRDSAPRSPRTIDVPTARSIR